MIKGRKIAIGRNGICTLGSNAPTPARSQTATSQLTSTPATVSQVA
jgi:hypothetical protein